MEIDVNIAAAHIGGYMLIKDNHASKVDDYKNYLQSYFQNKFFIKPFKCPICGNTFAFEKGMICNQTCYAYDRTFVPEGSKICDICSTPIRKDQAEKMQNFLETGNGKRYIIPGNEVGYVD